MADGASVLRISLEKMYQVEVTSFPQVSSVGPVIENEYWTDGSRWTLGGCVIKPNYDTRNILHSGCYPGSKFENAFSLKIFDESKTVLTRIIYTALRDDEDTRVIKSSIYGLTLNSIIDQRIDAKSTYRISGPPLAKDPKKSLMVIIENDNPDYMVDAYYRIRNAGHKVTVRLQG